MPVVEEQISKAKAALQNQNFRVVEATKKKEVTLASYAGEMEKLVVEANAKAERDVRQAEAYVIDTQLGADATYYQRDKNAQAILVKAKAEGEALTALAGAFQGEGGVNLIRRAYAGKIGDMKITGQPFTIESKTERLTYQDEAAVTKKKAVVK